MQKLLLFLENNLKYLLAAIFLGVPLYPKFPLFTVPGTYVAVRLEDTLLFVLGIVTVILYSKKIKSVWESKTEKSIILYTIIGGISLICAILLTKSVVPHIGLLHWLRRIEYMLGFFAGLYLFKYDREKNIDFFLKLIVIIFPLITIYGLGQRYLSWPVIITQNLEYSKGIALRWIPGSHINSTFAGHYDLAAYIILTLPILVVLFVSLKDKWTRFFLGIAILGGYWLLAVAASRISVVSYIVSVGIALILSKRVKFIPLVFLFSIVFFAFSGDLVSRYSRIIDVIKINFSQNKTSLLNLNPVRIAYAQDQVIKRRVSATPTPKPLLIFEDRSTSIRLNVEWPRAIRAFTKNPLLGTGYSSITLATDNEILRLLGEVGILGLFSFILIFIRLFQEFAQNFKNSTISLLESSFLNGLAGSFVGILLVAFFIDIFEASKFAIIFWLMLGMGAGILRGSKSRLE